MRVLLVEDDRMIAETVQEALKDAAYAAVACQHYDALLLDLGLPGKDGLTVLATLRSKGNRLPVLVITARDALEDRLIGLDSGADDYLLKPFDIAELLARLRAVLRRKGGSASPLLSNGLLSLDPANHQVTLAHDDIVINLSAREFSLLYALMLRPGGILSRSELEERIYGWGDEVESNAVEYLIHSLRKKLGNEAIKNIRGVGWMVVKNG